MGAESFQISAGLNSKSRKTCPPQVPHPDILKYHEEPFIFFQETQGNFAVGIISRAEFFFYLKF